MEGYGGLRFSNVSSAARKKRSSTFRRPRNDSQPLSDFRDISPLSSTPPSDNVSKVSSDENNIYNSIAQKKEVSLNICCSRASFSNIAEAESAQNIIKFEDGGSGESDEASNNVSFRGSNEQRRSGDNSNRCSEGVLAPSNWKGTSNLGHLGGVSDGVGHENKVRKVKLKVGGVTCTINAKSPSDGASGVGSSYTKSSRCSDTSRRPKLILQDNSDDSRSFNSDKGSGLQGVPVRNSSNPVSGGDGLRGRTSHENTSMKQNEPVRKSKRVPKRRLLDGVLDDRGDDEAYFEKVKTSKVVTDYAAEYEDDEEGGSRKQRKMSRVLNRNIDNVYDVEVEDYGSSRLVKEGKKSRSGRASEDTDYVEDEDPVSDGEPETRRKKARKEFVDLAVDSKKEMMVTTRQRTLQTGKDVSSNFSASLIAFPNGLPPAAPRKQKEKLSEVEQQLKKAEAAQRRRMQVEKAARESEAEAIRKILGQDSSRKKRELKIKKRQEELAQERAANALFLASDTVRWIMGPSGTVVTFPNELGLPSIFDPKPCSYPPPREKCAGPSCTNPYKYRDSKSKLPLCSLQCYKAIHKKMRPVTAC